MRKLLLGLTCLTALSVGAIHPSSAADSCTVDMSHYTGWEPLTYAQDSGIAKKWGDKYKVPLKITEPMDYVVSYTQYTMGNADGVAIANIDALIPSYGGKDTTVLIVGDFSNGNDGILVADSGTTVKDLKNKTAVIAGTVSDYLIARALQLNGMSDNDVVRSTVSELSLASQVSTARHGSVFATWNPILLNGRNTPGMEMIFSSAQIPNEIIDTVVVKTSASEACKRAITGAWYEVMALMSGTGHESTEAIKAMAAQSGGTVGEFNAQLRTTALFTKPADAVTFTSSAELKKTMELVRGVAFSHHMLVGTKDIGHVGIRFPDGSVLGNEKNVKLRFDTTYMQLAADGKL